MRVWIVTAIYKDNGLPFSWHVWANSEQDAIEQVRKSGWMLQVFKSVTARPSDADVKPFNCADPNWIKP